MMINALAVGLSLLHEAKFLFFFSTKAIRAILNPQNTSRADRLSF